MIKTVKNGTFRSAMKKVFLFLDRTLPYGVAYDFIILSIRFCAAHGRLPKRLLSHKATFNDFIFNRMIKVDWSELEIFATDKGDVKSFVKKICPEVHSARTHDLIFPVDFSSFSEFENYMLQYAGKPLVAKPTHASGCIVFLRQRPLRAQLMRLYHVASSDYYRTTRESQYKNLERKILIEEDLSIHGAAPADYKFFCSYGEIYFCQIDVDRYTNHRRVLVTPSFSKIDVRYQHDWPKHAVQKPSNFEDMLQIAGKISRLFKFVRVDLYSIKSRVFFGELTFTPEGSAGKLSSEEFGIAVLEDIRKSCARSNLGAHKDAEAAFCWSKAEPQ